MAADQSRLAIRESRPDEKNGDGWAIYSENWLHSVQVFLRKVRSFASLLWHYLNALKLLFQPNLRLFRRAWVKGRKCSYCQIILPFLDTILRDRLKVEYQTGNSNQITTLAKDQKETPIVFISLTQILKQITKFDNSFLKQSASKIRVHSISQIMLITKLLLNKNHFRKDLANFSLWIRFQ